MSQLPRDHTGRALAAWSEQVPELDLAPAHVLARIRRLMSLLEPLLEPPLARFGLNHAAFDTLSTLRRIGPPYSMTASDLAEQCLRTSATLTTRIARLEREGLVQRSSDPNDGRAVVVALTERGLQLIDDVAPVYLEAERLALSGLDDAERDEFTQTLQRLLLTFEGLDVNLANDRRVGAVPALGLWLESLHHSTQMRRAVGLPDRLGMIIASVSPGGPAQLAGLAPGDLVVSVDDIRATSVPILNHHLDAVAERASDGTIELIFSRQDSADKAAIVSLAQPAAL